jgi:hypothetical protein
MIAHPTPDPRARLEALRGVVDPRRERLRGQNGIPLTPEETRRVYEDVRDLQARPEGLDPDHRAWVEEIWRDTAMFWVEAVELAGGVHLCRDEVVAIVGGIWELDLEPEEGEPPSPPKSIRQGRSAAWS